jgi:DNA primase
MTTAADGRQSENPREPHPSTWAHVDLAELLAAAGNQVAQRRNGSLVSGHEPVHASRSGSCLVVWPESGRWWCSSCRQGGDAISLLMGLEGKTFPQARIAIVRRFGLGRS